MVSCLVAWLAWCVAAPAEAQTVRKSVTALTPAEIASLRKGVATMMARNGASRTSADWRRSWQYWANMHSHFGPACRGPVTGSGMAGVGVWTASSPSETATWCKCAHGTDDFLTWHRMYVYFFEQVLRQASGDPTLTLPYWDYATDPRLPEAFRAATYVDANGQTAPNPLRIAGRRASLNSGASGIAPASASASNALAATTYATFRSRLESTPHGAIHCAVATGGCPTGILGAVPSAALDPIFYLHHANIDRLYECWLKVDEAARLPSAPAILDATYTFIDRNGGIVTRKPRDMLTTAQLGYVYSAGADCPAPGAAPALVASHAEAGRWAPAASGAQAEEGIEMAETDLRRGVTTLPLAVEAGEAAGAARSSATAGSALVVVEGFEAARTPGVLYNVYLANPRGRREQVGVIDFFGFDAQPSAGGHGHGHGPAGRRFEFDATEALGRLGLAKGQDPAIVFEPTTGLSDSTVSAAISAIPADAGVRFRRAWLQLAP